MPQKEKNVEYTSHSREETLALGRRFGEKAQPGEVYALDGDLGAGKSVWAKGFAEGLGIREPVNSPTFTIMQVYEGGRLTLNHLDVYRIEDVAEMDEIGYDEVLGSDGVCLVEWADMVRELLPPETIRVTITRSPGTDMDERHIVIQGKTL